MQQPMDLLKRFKLDIRPRLTLEGTSHGYCLVDEDDCQLVAYSKWKNMEIWSEFWGKVSMPFSVLEAFVSICNDRFEKKYTARVKISGPDTLDMKPILGNIYLNYDVDIDRYFLDSPLDTEDFKAHFTENELTRIGVWGRDDWEVEEVINDD